MLDNYFYDADELVQNCFDNNTILSSSRTISKRPLCEYLIHAILHFFRKSQDLVIMKNNQSIGPIFAQVKLYYKILLIIF